ncbi:Protein of unknown function [Pyronema omphalodes CBS 100304]|uniref:Uncharacterized protein n=1 Tax=Pyronema omphalodes (strain CBS 100304) TaxID=1076935 RepID=U4LDL7_PYROM|nr:Protein of unknown function [Pyronema omphalodes CBS 100304]
MHRPFPRPCPSPSDSAPHDFVRGFPEALANTSGPSVLEIAVKVSLLKYSGYLKGFVSGFFGRFSGNPLGGNGNLDG